MDVRGPEPDPEPRAARRRRAIILVLIGLVAAAATYPALGPFLALSAGLALPLSIGTVLRLHAAHVERLVAEGRREEKRAQLALLDEVCRTEARDRIRQRYRVEERYPLQYDPAPEQRMLLEQVTKLYRRKRNEDAERVLEQAHQVFPGSPYLAARHARMLLQDLRISEAAALLDRALAENPDEVSLLILRDGVTRADAADDDQLRAEEVRVALSDIVEWAGMQLELIVGKTRSDVERDLDVVIH